MKEAKCQRERGIRNSANGEKKNTEKDSVRLIWKTSHSLGGKPNLPPPPVNICRPEDRMEGVSVKVRQSEKEGNATKWKCKKK